jgi:hypothetical protein
MSIPQDFELTANCIWDEQRVFICDSYTGDHGFKSDKAFVCLRAFFFSRMKFGAVFVKVDSCHPGSILRAGAPFTRQGTVIDAIAVKSQDYRDTISRAQEIWAEKLDDYIAQAVELMEGKGK